MPPDRAPFSYYTLAVLVVVLVASWAVLSGLMRRWTVGRRRDRIVAWGRSHGLRELATDDAAAVPDLLRATTAEPRAVVAMSSADGFVGRLRTATTPASKTPLSPALWNVVVLRRSSPAVGGGTATAGGISALRPTHSRVSLIDLYGAPYSTAHVLLSFPSVAAPDEFVVFGTEGADVSEAVDLARSGMLPADVGVVLAADRVVLDFSAREFDDLELSRAWELARQIAGRAVVRAT